MKIPAIPLLVLLAPLAAAFTTRRVLLQNAAIATAGAIVVKPAKATITACPPKSKNCLTTTWIASDAKTAASDIAEIFNSYPQAGQNNVDLGGWKFVQDNLSTNGDAKLEYMSGIGNFAKFLNGGKPFVDDVSIEIADGGVVNIKSSSRVGDSDLGVNQKRLQFLAAQARNKGWDVPEPKY